MKFIKSITHGLINPDYIRRILPGGDEKNPTLTLHVDGEGTLDLEGEDALSVMQQVEKMTGEYDDALGMPRD